MMLRTRALRRSQRLWQDDCELGCGHIPDVSKGGSLRLVYAVVFEIGDAQPIPETSPFADQWTRSEATVSPQR